MKKAVLIIFLAIIILFGCDNQTGTQNDNCSNLDSTAQVIPDTLKIPNDEFGEAVNYGRKILLNTAFYIGPKGIVGSYTANNMTCSNCHQEAGTKPFSYNLMRSHERYPQYRSRENRILTLADRVNNCVMRPHNGKPLPYEGIEMTAILSYLKWINSFVIKKENFLGEENLKLDYLPVAASPTQGAKIYAIHCVRCHQNNGEGQFGSDSNSYLYPPLWGPLAYQAGSSMHRVTKMAAWLKANMPHKLAAWNKPVLTNEEAFHLAAFINNDEMHLRPQAATRDYAKPLTKPIDYDLGPFADTFDATTHKYGPFPPIVNYWKEKGQKLTR
jgi:thiosulfate dehydrogenase